ncbi:hypothetical protein [Hydrogenimonas sp. SS33]|uniref:hypothetical protein n=1 Tax=Hydrogenimonas leucolamina TaxID=2954236 RepID=UPI00336BE28B
MTTQEKIAFLMETIPSEKEVAELRRKFLFSRLENDLLLDASGTLASSSPETPLIDWAYAILQFHFEKSKNRQTRELPIQEKMERIIALFSNTEDLQQILKEEEWNPGDRRAIQLVSHFVANDIPLMTNIKLVDKVYHLLENAYLPPDIASKYFGRGKEESERETILEKYRAYREKKAHKEADRAPLPPRQPSFWKRYAYLFGAAAAVAGIFLAGFFTAKLLYENKTVTRVTVSAQAENPRKKRPDALSPEKQMAVAKGENIGERFIANRIVLQKGLESLGLEKKVDFAKKLLAKSLEDVPLPHGKNPADLLPLPEKRAAAGARLERDPRLKLAVVQLSKLKGLRLPLSAEDINATLARLPKGYEVGAVETPATRLVYATKEEKSYPLEIYSFIGEPTITRYTFVTFGRGHLFAVPSDIWHFSDAGELRAHRHFIYQGGKISPAQIITDLFLPGDETIHIVSVGKLDRYRQNREHLVERYDYLPSGKLLHTEKRELDRLNNYWQSRLVERVWYDEGKKIKRQIGKPQHLSAVTKQP